jgi:hypothetical protein
MGMGCWVVWNVLGRMTRRDEVASMSLRKMVLVCTRLLVDWVVLDVDCSRCDTVKLQEHKAVERALRSIMEPLCLARLLQTQSNYLSRQRHVEFGRSNTENGMAYATSP